MVNLEHLKLLSDISVIIYVHNNSDSIAKCFESIFNQLVAPSEIIIIDDLSTDESYKICEEISKKVHPNILKLCKNNYFMGKAASLNKGVRLSSKSYLSFIECNEILYAYAFDYLFRMTALTNADMVYSNSYADEKLQNIKSPIFLSENFQERVTDIENNRYYWSVRAKIFKREFLIKNDISFEENLNFSSEHEILFMFQCLMFDIC